LVELDEFKFILSNLCNKIDKNLEMHENLVNDYLLENIQLTESISNEKVIVSIFKKALLNLTLNYKYFMILIVKNLD